MIGSASSPGDDVVHVEISSVHPEDERLFKKDGEPRAGGCSPFPALQLRSDSFDDPNDAGDGRRRDGSALRSRLDSGYGR